MMKSALLAEGNIWAGYRKDRSDWMPEEIKAKHGPDHTSKMAYFAGCTASYVEQDIAQGTAKLLDAAGVDFTMLGNKENCCGIPMLVCRPVGRLGMRTCGRTSRTSPMQVLTRIVTSCPACWMVWAVVYPQWAKKLNIPYNISTKHYSEILSDALKAGTLSSRTRSRHA